VKERDDNNFYRYVKRTQGFIEKVMIFYKNLNDKDMTMNEYIQTYSLKNPPEIMTEQPIKNLPVECLVSLYE
jgi:hypothetical protein